MKKILITLSVFVFAASSLFAQKALLWQISGNGLQKPSYLFGTIHMIPKKDFFFTRTMDSAFIQSEKLVLEADIFNLSLAQQIDLAKQMFIPGGKTYKHYMDSLEYLHLKQVWIDSLGVKEKKMEKQYIRIKPFFVTALLLKDKVGKTEAYEEVLNKKAKKQKKQLGALETVEFQIGLANGMSIEEQLKDAASMAAFESYYQMVDLYKQQDIEGLMTLSLKEYDTPKEEEFMELFVNKRNADWVTKIPTLISEQSCFIAVGSLHLPGEKGVIELLRKQGYTLTPMN